MKEHSSLTKQHSVTKKSFNTGRQCKNKNFKTIDVFTI